MEPEPEPEPVDSVAAVAAGVAAGAQQIDESMSDIGDLMADMFGAVAVAIDGQAQGGPRAVVAARRRQRELDEQEQRDREAAEAAAAAGSAAPRVPGATAGRAAVTTPPRAGGVAGARGDARSGAAASGVRTAYSLACDIGSSAMACRAFAQRFLVDTCCCWRRAFLQRAGAAAWLSGRRAGVGGGLAADSRAAALGFIEEGRGRESAPAGTEPRGGASVAERVRTGDDGGGEAADTAARFWGARGLELGRR